MCFSWRPKLIDIECYFKTIKCPHLDENVLAVKAKTGTGVAKALSNKTLYKYERRFYRILKSQITSTKFQINLKSQCPMTKTFAAVVPCCYRNPCSLVIRPFSTNAGGKAFGIWNFGYWELFVIWFLVLGIFIWLLNFVYLAPYLFKCYGPVG